MPFSILQVLLYARCICSSSLLLYISYSLFSEGYFFFNLLQNMLPELLLVLYNLFCFFKELGGNLCRDLNSNGFVSHCYCHVDKFSVLFDSLCYLCLSLKRSLYCSFKSRLGLIWRAFKHALQDEHMFMRLICNRLCKICYVLAACHSFFFIRVRRT